jgi:hypothetical protein
MGKVAARREFLEKLGEKILRGFLGGVDRRQRAESPIKIGLSRQCNAADKKSRRFIETSLPQRTGGLAKRLKTDLGKVCTHRQSGKYELNSSM